MKIHSSHIVLTGAAGGFGRELTFLFGKKGGRVLAIDINGEALKKLARECEEKGFDVTTKVLDVTKAEQWDGFVQELKKDKIYPDVWINNAGLAYPEAFEKLSPEKFDRIIDVNLKGTILGTRAALERMIDAQKGVVVNLSSIAGHVAAPFMAPYNASKHAVVGFTRGLQQEYAHRRIPIRFLLVSPAFADTAITRANPEFEIPWYFKWSIMKPEQVARQILRAIEKGETEIYPGVSTRGVLALYSALPRSFYNVFSRFLVARNWKERLGLEGVREGKR